MSILYSVPIHECAECVKQLCDGILFYDKDAVVVVHISTLQSNNFYVSDNERIIVNPIQYDTAWCGKATRIHISNYLCAKDKFDISHVVFFGSNCLMLKNPIEYFNKYDAGFSEQMHDRTKRTPPLLNTPALIGWAGWFPTDKRFLSILSELNSDRIYGCIIDCTFVNSTIMDKICYFFNKYFINNTDECPEEVFIPTIACNLATNLGDSPLHFGGGNLVEFKKIQQIKDDYFNKPIDRNMENEIRRYYNSLIYSGDTFLIELNNKMYHFYENIQGWFNYQDIYTEMVNTSIDGDHFVELGVWRGCSTAFIGVEIYNSNKKIKFDAIDCFDVTPQFGQESADIYEETKNNLKELTNIGIINLIKDYTFNAVKNYLDESLTFCFIDASHEYNDVKRDLLDWLPKIKKGGVIAGHDYDPYFPGVYSAVNEVLGKDNVTLRNTSFFYKKN